MPPRARVAMTLTQDWHAVPGGTAVAANAMAAALSATGIVDVLGFVPAGRAPEEPWTPPVPTVASSLPLPWLYESWDRIRRPRVTSVSGEVDLVHLTIPIACPPEGVPMVATVHDVLPLTMPEMFTRRGARIMRRGLQRIRDEASMVIVPTEGGRSEFVAAGFDPERLAVVPLGVEGRPVPAESEVAAVLRRHEIESPYVLFVGTDEPRKGLDVLLGALVHLDRDDLTLVAAGPQGWGPDTLARTRGLAGNVRRLGFVDPGDLDALRAGSALCCLPSRAEGFGLPVLEAMAMSAPVVTTIGTPMAEVARGVAALVAPGDEVALADSIASVLEDPQRRAAMGEAGRERAARYTWERTAGGVLEVYERVLGGGVLDR